MLFLDRKTDIVYEGEPSQMFGCLLDGGSPTLFGEEASGINPKVPPERWGSSDQFIEYGINYDNLSSVVFAFLSEEASAI